MNEVEKILEAFGTKVVEDLRKSLSEKLQAKASRYQSKYNSGSTNPGESALGASIKYRIVDSSEGIKLNVLLLIVDDASLITCCIASESTSPCKEAAILSWTSVTALVYPSTSTPLIHVTQ